MNQVTNAQGETFARVAQITSKPGKPGRYPISAATWWRLVREKRAPQPVKLGPGTTAWRMSELIAWEAEQAAKGVK